jgi:hypothetical protein
MGLTRAEQETIFRWDEDEKVVHVYSASPVTWRKLARLGLTPHRETTFEGAASGRFYRLPLSQFRWGRRAVRSEGARKGNLEALARARQLNKQARQAQNGEGSPPAGGPEAA